MLSEKAWRKWGQDHREGILPTTSTSKSCWKANMVFRSMYRFNLNLWYCSAWLSTMIWGREKGWYKAAWVLSVLNVYLDRHALWDSLFMLCCKACSFKGGFRRYLFSPNNSYMHDSISCLRCPSSFFYSHHSVVSKTWWYDWVPFSIWMNFYKHSRFFFPTPPSPAQSGPCLVSQWKTIPLAMILLMIIHLHVPFQELSLPSRREVSAGPLAVIIIIRPVSLHTVYAYHLHLGGFFLKPITSAAS